MQALHETGTFLEPKTSMNEKQEIKNWGEREIRTIVCRLEGSAHRGHNTLQQAAIDRMLLARAVVPKTPLSDGHQCPWPWPAP